jgi:hypothetical protein
MAMSLVLRRCVKGSLRFGNMPFKLKANDGTHAVKIAFDRGFFEI